MKITPEEARHIAALAYLDFSDQEYEALATHLSDILDYVEMLRELDTSNVSPTSHLLESGEAFRDDVGRPSLSETEALANAPERGGDHFKVPKIIG
ncbi:MAG: Asp-tRNA(Asn)/Glu-tRNA(Gln) amidotransferase subunit GatC [Acidobacteriota bacterium]